MTLELIAHCFALIGSLFFLVASVGLYRMPDAFSRIHAATKASSLGVILLASAAAIFFRDWAGTILSILTVLLVFLTAPLACHCISTQLLKKDQ
ncbi:monovalent cation/H(+) antiporter subunit G [Sulfuriroseicoccus oceanibius]|uniref:Monovalent cation/H(+) antiporter subunit G n=1 Tax=Sulfuriroseicoccus oceanibius TaxID=2707525 RepID=A0A6B3L4C4_9BACT|nr:monovalent cation/H(+) antiporter subunit G [Sulfuriroseicoccus oceanibius]QQL45569.1 monovalent cation/H(+) antiporter subunit G [Sulfuriroseicoccus oceanibius]